MTVLHSLPAHEQHGLAVTDQSHIVGLGCDWSLAVHGVCSSPQQDVVAAYHGLAEPEVFERFQAEVDMIAQAVRRSC